VLAVAQKEATAVVKTTRYAIGFAILLVLLVTVSVSGFSRFAARYDDYVAERQGAGDALRAAEVISEMRAVALKPPSFVGVLAAGPASGLGDKYSISPGEIPVMGQAASTTGTNRWTVGDGRIDMVQVVGLVMSLLVLLFSFDAVSGEREQGTLGLTLSQPLRRRSYLSGKILGLAGVASLPIGGAFIAAAATAAFAWDESLPSMEWGAFALLVLFSVLYAAVFATLGLLISACCRSSWTSLTICLVTWMILCLLVPVLADTASSRFVRYPSSYELSDGWSRLDSEYRDLVHDFEMDSIGTSFMIDHRSNYAPGMRIVGLAGPRLRVETSHEETTDFVGRLVAHAEPLKVRFADRVLELNERWSRQALRHDKMRTALGFLSPYVVYRRACEALAATDTRSYLDFVGQARVYREQYLSWLDGNEAFRNPLYFASLDAPEGAAEALKRDLPRFGYNAPGPWDRLRGAGWFASVLVLLSPVLWLFALVKFDRCDPR